MKNDDRTKVLKEGRSEIYCFQEVKCHSEERINMFLGKDILNDYIPYNAISTFKKGYAGVTTLIRKDIPVLYSEIPKINMPGVSGFVEGRIVTTIHPDFSLINVYSVNSAGGKQFDREQFDIFLLIYVHKIRDQFKKPIILCGDLNVCATKFDYWSENYRRSNSPGLYEFEKYAFKRLVINGGLVDSFRNKHGKERKYSWYQNKHRKDTTWPWELKHGWRLDYFMVDSCLLPRITESDIMEFYQKIDHSPVYLDINP